MMYKCIHCSKGKQLCECHNPFKTPDTPHDWPGKTRILRLMFELPDFNELSPEFVELLNSTMAKSMDMIFDQVFVDGDRLRYTPLRKMVHDMEERKRVEFFMQSFYSVRPYTRTKHESKETK